MDTGGSTAAMATAVPMIVPETSLSVTAGATSGMGWPQGVAYGRGWRAQAARGRGMAPGGFMRSKGP